MPPPQRLGLAVEPGERARPDGERLRWRGAGIEDGARDAWLPFFIAWDVPAALHPGRTAIDHDAVVLGIARVEVAGDAARLRAWLGPSGDGLPIEVVDGDPACGRWSSRPTGATRSGSEPAPLGSGQGAVEVVDQIVGVLDAHRQSHEIVRHLQR